MSAQVELGWNNAELQAGAKNAEGIVRRSVSNMQGALKSLQSMDLGRVIGVVGAAYSFQQLAGGIAEATLKADDNKQSMLAVEGSIEGATRRLRELRDVARSPGLGVDQVAEADVRLRSVGLSAAVSERAIREVGNALALVGKGKADLDGVMLAFTQIVSNNGLKAEELNQIAERVPQIRRILSEAFGTADTEAIQKLNLSATEFIEKTLDGFAKLPRAVGGLRNSWDNLTDSITQSASALGEVAVPQAIVLFDDLAKTLGENREELKSVATGAVNFARIIGGTFGVVKDATDIVGQGWQDIINTGLRLTGITDGTTRHFDAQIKAAQELAKAQAAAAREADAHARAQRELENATARLTESQRQSAAFAERMRQASINDMVQAGDRQRALQDRLRDEAARTRDLTLTDTDRLEDAKKKLLDIDRQLNAVVGQRGGEEMALKLNIEREQVMQRIITLQQQLGEAQRRANEEQARANQQAGGGLQSGFSNISPQSPFGFAGGLAAPGYAAGPEEATRRRIIGVKYAGQLDPRYGLSGRPSDGLTGDYTPLAEHGPSRLDAFKAAQDQPSQFDLLQQQGKGGLGKAPANIGGIGGGLGGGPGAPLFNPAAASTPPAPGGDPTTVPEILRAMLTLWRDAL